MTSFAPGAVAVSHRRVLAIALPMTVAHVTTPLLGLVDATVIGRLGEAHLLGAVGLGAVVFDVLFWSFGALRMGTAGLTAQALGAGDTREIRLVLARALALSGIVGVLLVALQAPLAAGALAFTAPSPAVAEAFHTYFAVRIWAAPFTLANYAILGSVLGRARSDLGLVLQLGLNLANIALSVLLVMGFGLGIAGAAAATVAAEIAGTALGLAVLRHLGVNPLGAAWAEVLDRVALARTLAVNRDIMIRTAALLAAFALFTRSGAQAGDTVLAANAVLYNMVMIGGFLLDGLATAAETLCGQAVGARNEAVFRRAVRLSLGWSLALGALISAVFLVTGPAFVAFVTTHPGVRETAVLHLPYAALVPAAGAVAFAFDGIYIGATWNQAMRNLMLAALALFALVLFAVGSLGNTGLWIAFLVFTAARGLGQAAFYPRLAERTFGVPFPPGRAGRLGTG